MERNKNKRNKEEGQTKENTGDGDFEQGDEERETDKIKRKELKGQRDATVVIQQDFNSELRTVFVGGDGVAQRTNSSQSFHNKDGGGVL